MDGLGFNKIAAAVLATALGIVGLRELSSAVYAFHPTEKPGYLIEVAEEETGGAVAEIPPDWGTVLPAADIKAGEAVFQKCVVCHTITPGGANSTGPNIYDVVNKKPGTHAGFAYSTAMKDYGATHPSWTYAQLETYLKAPTKEVKGTKMIFVGLKKQEDRVNIIAYLRAQSPSPAAVPAPNPVAAAPAADAAAPAGEGAPVSATATPGATPAAPAAAGPAATPSSVATPKPAV